MTCKLLPTVAKCCTHITLQLCGPDLGAWQPVFIYDGCQASDNHMINICNLLSWLPQKVNGEAGRKGCKQREQKRAEILLQAAGANQRISPPYMEVCGNPL